MTSEASVRAQQPGVACGGARCRGGARGVRLQPQGANSYSADPSPLSFTSLICG